MNEKKEKPTTGEYIWYAILAVNWLAGTCYIYAKIGDWLPAASWLGYVWFVVSIAAFVMTVKDKFGYTDNRRD